MRARLACAVFVLCVSAALPWLVGCAGSGESGPAADVAIMTAIVADQPGQITSLAIATKQAGDTINAPDAKAEIRRPDGTADPVALKVAADGTKITVGRARVSPPVSGAADRVSQGQPGHADVPVLATVVAPTPGEITSATVETLEPGDTMNIEGATAHVQHADGTSDPVTLSIDDAHTLVTLGRAPVSPDNWGSQYWTLETLVIDGPMSVTDGPTGHTTIVGSLAFSFGVKPDGMAMAPKQIHATIPTVGTAEDRRVVVDGLEPARGYAWTIITDRDGGMYYSHPYVADTSGQAIIPDSLGRITAEILSGPKSRIELCFAGWPRYPPPPTGPPTNGGAPGGGGVPTRLDALIITGPLRFKDGHTGTWTELGGLCFGFEVLPSAVVVAPDSLAFSIPTNRGGTNRTVVVAGLAPGDFAETAIESTHRRMYESRIYRADASGGITLTDAFANLTAHDLSGPRSSFALFFARTDSNGDGLPDYF